MSAWNQSLPEAPSFPLTELPPFPRVALKALQLLASEDTETRQVVEVISTDAAFASELLQVANSPLFGFRQQVGTLRHAVVVLGRDRLRSLTMTVAMKSYLKAPFRDPIFQRCWQHSLTTALLASGLATICTMRQEEAYMAGLLHDIGKFGLLMLHPKDYSSLLRAEWSNPADVLERERSMFGIDHCEAGRWLLNDWGLTPALVLAAAHHHDEPNGRSLSLEKLVRLACRLAGALGYGTIRTPLLPRLEEIRDQLPPRFQEGLSLDASVLKAALDKKMSTLC